MTRTKTVTVRFGARTFEREVTLGEMATDAYFVENARADIERERDDLGRFRGGRVLGEVLA